MTEWNLFGSGSIAGSSVSWSTGFLAGINWKPTQNGLFLKGYRYFLADSGQPTGTQKFVLRQVVGGSGSLSNYVLVPGSTVTSGTLALGWNTVLLPVPLPLSGSVEYMAETGFSGNFVDVANQFGSGPPYSAGLTSGPLFAFSDTGGTASDQYNNVQGLFSGISGSDPEASVPTQGSNSSNFGIDIQVTDQAPPSVPYSLTPSQPSPVNFVLDTADNFTLGVEIVLSKACRLNYIRYFSPPGVTQLATECGVWAVQGTSLITASHVTSPSWKNSSGSAASPGDGQVTQNYDGSLILQPGHYKPSVFNGASSPAVWNGTVLPYWESPGVCAGGIV